VVNFKAVPLALVPEIRTLFALDDAGQLQQVVAKPLRSIIVFYHIKGVPLAWQLMPGYKFQINRNMELGKSYLITNQDQHVTRWTLILGWTK
jgi:hypothetical protein